MTTSRVMTAAPAGRSAPAALAAAASLALASLLAGCGGDAAPGRLPAFSKPVSLDAARSDFGPAPAGKPATGRQASAFTRREASLPAAAGAQSSRELSRAGQHGTPDDAEDDKLRAARRKRDAQMASGSMLKAIAAGRFEGEELPGPAVEIVDGEHEPIPSAPERRPVANLEEARARALEDLASDNPHLRFVAAREAGRLGIKEAAPLLAKLLAGPGAERLPAVYALGRIGGERSAKALAKALRRATDTRFRLAVVRALGATRARAALRPLERELLRGNTTVRIEAAGALGALGMREAVPSLKEALARRDLLPAGRVAAAAALARLGDASGVAALDRAAAGASPTLQVLALRGMAALAQGPTQLDEVGAAALRAHAERSVAAAVGSPHEEVWSEAMRVLARTRPRGAVPVLEALERGEARVARRARTARAAWGGPGAQEALVEALGSPSRLLRAAACGIMGSLGDRSATEHLARALADPSSSVRVSAAWALAAVGGEAAMKALERASASEDVPLSNAARQALGLARAREGKGARRPSPPRPAPGGNAEKEAGLVLERIVVGAGGRLFCAIRSPRGERRLLRRGEKADGGWRVEVIIPDGRGGGRVVLSRGEKTLDLRLGEGASGR